MEIHWMNLDGLEEKDRQGAEDRFRKLGASHNDLIDLRITGKKNGHRAPSSEEVRIACLARGREIVAARSADQVGRALHDAIEATAANDMLFIAAAGNRRSNIDLHNFYPPVTILTISFRLRRPTGTIRFRSSPISAKPVSILPPRVPIF